jgi:hypothetical protein
MRKLYLDGQVFGSHTLLCREGLLHAVAKCTCGNVKSFLISNLRRGLTKSCGCIKPLQPVGDLLGAKFGSLLVLGLNSRNPVRWKCRCDCGNEAVVAPGHLKSGHTRSCGCLYTASVSAMRKKMITHGMSQTKIYRRWRGMITRCSVPSDTRYPWYGARGIKVCDRWKKFENFLVDMGMPPPGMSLDRIDNDGDYKPGNCRWTTHQQNCGNRRSSHANRC